MGLNRVVYCLLVIITVLCYAPYVLHLMRVRKPQPHTTGVEQTSELMKISDSDPRNWSTLGKTNIKGIESLFIKKEVLHNQKVSFHSMAITHLQSGEKNIMFWNPGKAARSPLDFRDCEYSACAMTTTLRKADVLWLDVNSLKSEALPPRPPNQIWLFGSRDPPDLPMFEHLDRQDLNNQVNWTWYLLRGSTWQARYGHLQERPLPRKQYNEIFHRKSHDVAWFVSQCDRPSRRMEYVKRMRTQVGVHIYGLCGNFTCGSSGYHMGNKREECLNLLSRNYKFYLAFENSFCKDYVTEKFFNLFNDVDTIPVVRGGFQYHKFFPAGIYIDAADFPSPESLGAYLRELARDEQRYVRLLKRKNRFTRAEKPVRIACELCKAAHLREPRQVYTNLYRWLRAPGNCWRPRDL
ncbi:hypothetical protein RRG08_025588 [Elysia crispata]|uniref:Fucosyltransferase n=1 Tax=Elysia crispata TaxID=231223 RepID=A0AAE1CX99_9GAST|nr:hypothetical protein RRG08_025588 [Elysia crispata]